MKSKTLVIKSSEIPKFYYNVPKSWQDRLWALLSPEEKIDLDMPRWAREAPPKPGDADPEDALIEKIRRLATLDNK